MEFPDLVGIRPRVGWKNHVFQKNLKKFWILVWPDQAVFFLGLARIHNWFVFKKIKVIPPLEVALASLVWLACVACTGQITGGWRGSNKGLLPLQWTLVWLTLLEMQNQVVASCGCTRQLPLLSLLIVATSMGSPSWQQL